MDESHKSCRIMLSRVVLSGLNDALHGWQKGAKGLRREVLFSQVLLDSFYLLAFSGDCPHSSLV